MTTFIHYFVPEDNEKQESLNAFIIYKPYQDVRLKDIEENFPLPGKYYFRFKFEFMKKNVWIDFNNPNSSLPQFEGKIIMKVTRIKWENDIQNAQGGNSGSNLNVFPQF